MNRSENAVSPHQNVSMKMQGSINQLSEEFLYIMEDSTPRLKWDMNLKK